MQIISRLVVILGVTSATNEFCSSHLHSSESTFQNYGSRCVQLMLHLPFHQSLITLEKRNRVSDICLF
jgi:hypothetical protein